MLFNKVDSNSKITVEDKLLNNFKKNIHKINVISPLNNKTSIFNKTLNYAINEGKKVLYIINKDVLEVLNGEINYLHESTDSIYNKKINVCKHNIALYLDYKFDLIIYDEINSKAMFSRESVEKLLVSKCSNYGTMISYSMEKILDDGLSIYNLKNDFRVPLVEPRVITTRINLEDGIPSVVYEYLKWSINSNNKVLIYVPQDDKVDIIYERLKEIKEKLTENIVRRKKYEGERRLIKFLIAEEGILVTDDYMEEHIGLKPVNIMVFFSDSSQFSYKELVCIASRVNRVLKNSREEVIFICNNETAEIDKCRSILRELNKKAWEEGYFE